MTSQTMTIEELREEAKSLGVKGVHLFKDEDKLLSAIAEKKALKEDEVQPEVLAEAPRKKAPRMSVAGIGTNARQNKLDELNARYPEYEHQYRLMGTDADKIDAQGFEVVEGERLGDEIVVRTMKDSFLEVQEAKNAHQRKMMDAVDTEGSKILSLNANPKEPIGK